MDWGSVAGLVLALLGILVGQLLEGGRLGSLVQPTAFVIVMVGTFGAVLLQSGWPTVKRGVRMAAAAFRNQPDLHRLHAADVAMWSQTARREGLLSLERFMDNSDDPFITKGLRLLTDGIDPYKLREILGIEISSYETRERKAARIWDAAGGYAPTIGILGAVLGLIHVMENLSDPSRLGAGIAVAFVATIYGVGLANLVFLPIGGKLKTAVNDEVTRLEMLADAFCCIASGDNPISIEERMKAYER
ncbi:Flagellar motor rotation protein MotA [Oxalobacteraceae bacterium IMCC9480]|nr:Flagellar motor rotation protein MotA [Oxalobacteraceae bacterium IMCC9480]NDP60325.1 flagellar motor protein [Oxalobacteraceae bacterium]